MCIRDSFGLVRIEQFRQMRQFQNFADVLGHIAKLEISVGLANAGQSAKDVYKRQVPLSANDGKRLRLSVSGEHI